MRRPAAQAISPRHPLAQDLRRDRYRRHRSSRVQAHAVEQAAPKRPHHRGLLDVAQQHQTDQKLAGKDREGYTLVPGMSSWEFEAFGRLRR